MPTAADTARCQIVTASMPIEAGPGDASASEAGPGDAAADH